MEAVTVTTKPIIKLLVDDTNDTSNPVSEVQASADDRETFQQIVLYSEFELNQAEEVHKLIVFHLPRDPKQKIDWLEDLDDVAFASTDHDPYGRNPYGREPTRTVPGTEPPTRCPISRECHQWAENDLEFEEQLAREVDEQEEESNRRSRVRDETGPTCRCCYRHRSPAT